MNSLTMDDVTTELTTPLTAATDRCPNCNAQMAPDQRYCINCGERRSGGGLRDALPKTPVAAAPAAPKRRTLFASPSSSLIAGVGVLLLALGVGVLIGRTGHSDSGKAATPQVVTVSGAAPAAGTGSAAATTATAAGSAAAAKHAAKKHHASKAKTSAGGNSVQKTAAKNGVKLPPPTVKVGSKCQNGAKGCQGGKFTGNFFGGG